jgi:hypothetical protein
MDRRHGIERKEAHERPERWLRRMLLDLGPPDRLEPSAQRLARFYTSAHPGREPQI